MNKAGRNIKDRFSDFEPEIDDQGIDKRWEEIKYFLPQEKNRRGFFWYTRGGGLRLPLAIAAGLLTLFLALYFCLHDTNKMAGETTIVRQSPKPGSEMPQQKFTQPASKLDAITPESKTKQQLPGNNKPGNASAQAPVSLNASQSTMVSRMVKQHRVSAGIIKRSAAKSNGRPEHQKTAGQVGPVENKILAEQTNTTSVAAPQVHTTPNQFSSLAPGSRENPDILPIKGVYLKAMPEDSAKEQVLLKVLPDEPIVNRRRVLFLDVYGGPGLVKTLVSYQNLNEKQQGASLQLGLDLICIFKNRVQLQAAFTAGNNHQQAQFETMRNSVISKTVTNSSIVPGMPEDTAIYYRRVNSLVNIHSAKKINISLGFGYNIFTHSRWGVDLFGQAGLSLQPYQLELKNTFQSDTLLYLRTPSSKPLPDEISSSQVSQAQQLTIKSLQLVTGFTLSYFITNRTAIIVKPTYGRQLNNFDLAAYETLFKLHTESLYLNVGLRIRL